MELMTKIDIPVSEWTIPAGSNILLVGSCFADNIGIKMQKGGFNAMVNPFCTLYNPASIASILSHTLDSTPYTPESPELLSDSSGLWHSWMHHSRFSSDTRDSLLESINTTQSSVLDFLRSANVLVITLGTAIIYRLKSTGMLVANCHKQHDSLFIRERLAVHDITAQWHSLIQRLHTLNPSLRIIFTVSPIRHKRDGYHTNQISKGILLQSVDELLCSEMANGSSSEMVHCTSANGTCTYFPSYEIMLDELRDYRFYADDMIHPSEKAVEYIWQRFQDTYFDNKTKDAVAKATKSWLRTQHRSIIK